MAGPRRTRRRRFTLIVLVLVSITVLTLDFRDTGPVNSASNVVAAVFDPVRDGAAWLFRPVGNLWQSAFKYSDVKKENEALRRRVAALEAIKKQDNIDERIYRQLRDQAHITYLQDLPTVTAQVRSGPVSNFQQAIEIDRGSGDGIKVGMAVVTSQGLVGTVSQVHGGSATVQPITDPNLRFWVKVYMRTDKTDPGTLGQARGTGAGRPIQIEDGILSNVKVTKRDPVFTSGADTSTYPPGVPVGTVVAVKPTTDRTQQLVTVDPYVDFSRLSIVKVVLWEPIS